MNRNLNCWDLTQLFKTKDEYKKEIDKLSLLLNSLNKYKSKLSPDNLYKCLNEQSNISKRIESIYMYACLNRDLDLANSEFQAENEIVQKILNDFAISTAFINPEVALFKESELLAMVKDEKYQKHSFYLQEILRNKKHILTKDSEELLSQVSAFSSDFKKIFQMFDNADLKYKKVKNSKNELNELTHATYSRYLISNDGILRKNAFKQYYKGYIDYENTISSMYIASVKKDCSFAKIRNFDNALKQTLHLDNVNPVVYNNLLNSVDKFLPTLHDYVKTRKNILSLKSMHMWDMHVPLVEGIDRDYSYEEAKEIVFKALKPLGVDYQELLKKAYSEGWIDVYPKEGKRCGAYSWGSYSSPPYLLLNYSNTMNDIFTLAHELGHSLHSYYSNKNQCYEKASYPIFVAEVASTVNEVLLLKYMLKTVSGEQKKYLLNYYLEMFRTTLFRQTMFAEFEYIAHKTYENGIPLTGELLNDEYLKLNKKYYGNAVIHDNEIAYEWSRVPHFYSAFYVYKYATGLTSAITIACNLLDNPSYIDKYKKFLSSGGSNYPVQLLKDAGIDLETEKPFEIALQEFQNILKEFKTYK